MKEKIRAALEGSKADYTEIRIEEREASSVSFRGEDLENASAVVDTGGTVRPIQPSRTIQLKLHN